MIKKNTIIGLFKKLSFPRVLYIGTAIFIALTQTGCGLHYGVLDPKGLVATQQRKLFFDALALMLIVVLPVIVMSFAFVIRYRSSHKTAEYKPNWSHSYFLEVIWWSVPCIIISVLGFLTWKSTHELDPYKKLKVGGQPVLVEAVALRWKWLFIYPKQGIATVNYLELPVNRQVEFWITSDAPMSAFGIPQLGSQIYAMAGMRTRLHLIADAPGTYIGMDTQYNGDGFSEMKFNTHVVSEARYKSWIETQKKNSHSLSLKEYAIIAKPSIKDKPHFYGSVYPNLFTKIMEQFTKPNSRLHT